MAKFTSPFYPPRARWHGRLYHRVEAVKHRLHLERLQRPDFISARNFLAGLLVPGLAFYADGQRSIAKAIICGYLLAGLIFLIWLGYPFANLISGLMIGTHVTCILYLLRRQLSGAHLAIRLLVPLGLLLGLSQLVYMPLLGLVQNHLFMPLQMHGQVFVVQRQTFPLSVRRGDCIAYQVAEFRLGMYRVEAGYGLDRVIGLPGDRIQFMTNQFLVNDVPHPLQPHMPRTGEWVVPKKHWFVWPNLAITGHGATDEKYLSELYRTNGMIDQSKFVGRSYSHWFWRRQSIS
jgi:signal peptidase I